MSNSYTVKAINFKGQQVSMLSSHLAFNKDAQMPLNVAMRYLRESHLQAQDISDIPLLAVVDDNDNIVDIQLNNMINKQDINTMGWHIPMMVNDIASLYRRIDEENNESHLYDGDLRDLDEDEMPVERPTDFKINVFHSKNTGMFVLFDFSMDARKVGVNPLAEFGVDRLGAFMCSKPINKNLYVDWTPTSENAPNIEDFRDVFAHHRLKVGMQVSELTNEQRLLADTYNEFNIINDAFKSVAGGEKELGLQKMADFCELVSKIEPVQLADNDECPAQVKARIKNMASRPAGFTLKFEYERLTMQLQHRISSIREAASVGSVYATLLLSNKCEIKNWTNSAAYQNHFSSRLNAPEM